MTTLIRWLARLLVLVGVACLAWVATEVLSTQQYQARQEAALARARDASPTVPAVPRRSAVSLPGEEPAAIVVPAPAPTIDDDPDLVGRIEIPRIGVSAIVRAGEDAATLRRAVGHLPGTARPGETGNVALAGHRDTFFRGLRNVRVGDAVRLTTPGGDYRYRVRRMRIVDPGDVWVLDASAGKTLTLVTCYPFAYVGHAPQRFIVHAEQVSEPAPALRTAALMSDESRAAVGRPAVLETAVQVRAPSRPSRRAVRAPDRPARARSVSSPPQRASAARPRRPPESASASASAKKVFSKVFSPFKRLFGKGSSRSGK